MGLALVSPRPIGTKERDPGVYGRYTSVMSKLPLSPGRCESCDMYDIGVSDSLLQQTPIPENCELKRPGGTSFSKILDVSERDTTPWYLGNSKKGLQ